MKRTSSPVSSSQTAVHKRLESVVRKNLHTSWKQPFHQPTVKAFEKLLVLENFESHDSLILDSGCGTGASTKTIARQFPDSLVIGIDRSLVRLSKVGTNKFPVRDENAFWIQAELATFWRLAVQKGWRPDRHYLLYPNPWPKPGQLQRRWYAHPVFPRLLELGGVLEMRCNWKIYAKEFQVALNLACPSARVEAEAADSERSWDEITTPFGLKYGESGHQLYRVVADLSQ